MINVADSFVGHVLNIYLAKATDGEVLNTKVASGGAVTAILNYALDEGLIDGVVTAKRTNGLEGKAVVARSRKELLATVGNKWSIVPFASRIKTKIEENNLNQVAVVCLPCQAQFFGQMRDFPMLETDFGERIEYIISLFCMGTFAFETFINYLHMNHGIKGRDVRDIVLRGDVIEVHHPRGVLRLSIREIYRYLQVGCLVCTDYTGSWSDISAGVVETKPGWTILIARNKKADELIKNAKKRGYIEVRDGSPFIGDVITGAREKLARSQKNMMCLF
ncbi:coenzyme F420 hydrogenase [Thermococcus indicus]|uniref:Coenzyme F420 hydrogenase n=2 Tax=Thermococcus TaxID=2263 RepID=A0A5C0SI84_9EURY|nr:MULTISPECIES: Coenzyme F420 hydrogenase/dehydrogenase, beta subunit C-terminal domain [Thermococcus]QDA31255.1 coenzyme F420 hydrogenase [Thermococcus indicus]QEK14285.1 coenzyme F420 hydrogenase [Thermococcus aciditolerans]